MGTTCRLDERAGLRLRPEGEAWRGVTDGSTSSAMERERVSGPAPPPSAATWMLSFQLDTDSRANVDASYRGASGRQGVCWRPASSTPSKRFGRDDRVAALHQFGPRRRRGSGGRLCPIAALRGAVDAEQRSGLLGGAGGVTPFGRLQQSDVLAGRPVQRTSCVNPGRLTGVGARGGQSPHVDRGTSPRTPWRPPSRRWRAAQRRG
jgi:hypothetical protein